MSEGATCARVCATTRMTNVQKRLVAASWSELEPSAIFDFGSTVFELVARREPRILAALSSSGRRRVVHIQVSGDGDDRQLSGGRAGGRPRTRALLSCRSPDRSLRLFACQSAATATTVAAAATRTAVMRKWNDRHANRNQRASQHSFCSDSAMRSTRSFVRWPTFT